ncbi:2TM domain-containing protein [Flavobacterium daemonense]|uniref:2TM domain-containing protein n=1 Tax=Flavobacterium daemonense TaxID=1393049 RepID=UPI00118477C3|nr:2TM domain-containing protein [Flavobacterium daemonense]KAF2332596.1 2TM domain-containing protein [Flavobacterium daemonense]
MDPNYTEAERYYQAQKRVKEIKEFYQHLTVYILCNPIVIVVNLMTSPGYLWCLYCVFGWGFAIVMHGLAAFRYSPFFNKEWEARKIQEFLDQEKENRNKFGIN